MDVFATRDKKHRKFICRSGASSEKKLPHLFFRKSKSLPPIVRTLSTITANKASTGIQNQVTSANEKFLSLQRAITELIRYMMVESDFSTFVRVQAVK